MYRQVSVKLRRIMCPEHGHGEYNRRIDWI